MEVAEISRTKTGEISYIIKKGTNKKFAWKVPKAQVLTKISKDSQTGRLCLKVDLATKDGKDLRYVMEQFKNMLIKLQVESRTNKQTKEYIERMYVEKNDIENGCYKFEIGLNCQFIKYSNIENKCYKDSYICIKPGDNVELIIEYVGFLRNIQGYQNIYVVKQVKRFVQYEISENNLFYNKESSKYGDEDYDDEYNNVFNKGCDDIP